MHAPDNDNADHNSIPSQVEHPDIEAKEDEVIEASYKIVKFGGFVPDDYMGFIMSSWLHSLRFGNDMLKLTDSDTYYRNYSRFIEALLNRKDSILRLAVLTEDPDVALGWSLSERNILHYIYVPKDYRKEGIGRSLLPDNFNTISHITAIGLSIWHAKFPNVRFNPFL